MLIQITNKCHMECPHCMQDSTYNGEHMSHKTFMNSIKFGMNICNRIYNISGGEPTENPELLNMCKSLNEIFQSLKGALVFVLSSNGMWIKDKEKTKIVKEIQSLPSCCGIQVYSNKEYYKEHEWLKAHIRQFDIFKKVTVVTTPIENMQDLGRARTCEMAQKQIKESHYYMSCLNPILVAKQVNSPQQWGIRLQQSQQLCKPLVDYKGDVHLSESWLCPSVGNVNIQDIQTIWANIQKTEPCKNCAGCRKFLASKDAKIIQARKIIWKES